MATEASASAERGMSAPPEVIFNTATDPDRTTAWLPPELRRTGNSARLAATDGLRARWGGGGPREWSLALQVQGGDAGGATVRLELAGDAPYERLAELAEETVVNLAREVRENLTAG